MAASVIKLSQYRRMTQFPTLNPVGSSKFEHLKKSKMVDDEYFKNLEITISQ